MPSRRVRLVVTGLEPWIDGLKKFGEPTPSMERRWAAATDVFFDRTQAAVHVITAGLKASGRQETEVGPKRITGVVTYGGTEECDYAVYEFARGGKHNALRIGFVETQRVFQEALAEMLEDEVASWK